MSSDGFMNTDRWAWGTESFIVVFRCAERISGQVWTPITFFLSPTFSSQNSATAATDIEAFLTAPLQKFNYMWFSS